MRARSLLIVSVAWAGCSGDAGRFSDGPLAGEAGSGDSSAGSAGTLLPFAGASGSEHPSGGNDGGARSPLDGAGGRGASGAGGEDNSGVGDNSFAGASGEGASEPLGGAGGALQGQSGAGGDGGGSPEPRLRHYVLDSGHIDLFEITYDVGLAELVTRVRDDTRLYGLTAEFRLPETVSVCVDSETTALQIPEQPEYAFLGAAGSTVFLLGQSQEEGKPWPGWSTRRLLGTLPLGVELLDEVGAVELAIEVEGPGDVFTFMIDAFGLPIHRYIDTSDDVPDVIPIEPNAHVHTAWAFTQPGHYHLETTPSAMTKAGTLLEGATQRYHFYIGSSRLPVIEAPVLEITGLANSYAAAERVALLAVQDRPTSFSNYLWYRWDNGGYVLLPGITTESASFLATTSGQYAAALLSGPSGRVVATAYADVVVHP
jgi:surface-anchored protein